MVTATSWRRARAPRVVTTGSGGSSRSAVRPRDVLASQPTVAEGAATAPVAVELAARLGVELPIIASVLALLRGERTAQELVPELMGRDRKTELAGIDEPTPV